MKKVGIALSAILVGVGVAITYHIFENVVHGSIDLIWYNWLNTDAARWLLIPTCVVIALLFFGIQHWLDPASEKQEEEGLGDIPALSVANYLKVLAIGFFSLVAGASLGPEAILVPASLILGGYIGQRIFGKDKDSIKLLTAAGFMALFTAFFSSFAVGILSVLLAAGQLKLKLTGWLIIIAVIASGSSLATLNLLEGNAYVQLPAINWRPSFESLLLSVLLVGAGYVSIYAMALLHNGFKAFKKSIGNVGWIAAGLIAGLGLAALYLLGGPLVEFTGNKSIVPMFEQATNLGVWGLLWVLVVKLAAIAWSKALGYRGGMIFPTIFVASVLVAIVQQYVHDFNFIYGLIAVLIGAGVANKASRILV